MALSTNIATGSGKLPPSRPVTTTLPPLASAPVAKASDFSEPTKSQAANTPPPVALISACARLAVGRIEGRRGAGLERRLALAGVDVGDDRRLRKQRARDRKPHHADAAEADQQRRAARGVRRQAA